MGRNTGLKGVILTTVSAVMFGFMPLFAIMLRSGGMYLIPSIALRFCLGTLFYGFLLLVSGKIKELHLKKGVPLRLIITALLFCSTSFFLFISYARIPSGLATVIHFTYPVIITIFSVKAGRDRLTPFLLIAIVCSFCGILLVTDPFNAHFDLWGVVSAFVSAIVFALYTFLINDEDLKQIDNITFVFYNSGISCVVLLFISTIQLISGISVSQLFGTFSYQVLYGMLGTGLFCAVAVAFFAIGVKDIGGPVGGALSAFEPLTAVIIGVLFFKETIPAQFGFGIILILSSTLILSLKSIIKLEKRKPKII
ncbi:MAG: DMT family transporter [Sphaerochaetaceae bacterium]